MTDPIDVDTMLERIAREGTLESTGSFTLDSSRLREKLRRYRLTNPWQYLWFAVRAGVAGGARRVAIDSGKEFLATLVALEMPSIDLGSIARLSDTSLVGREDRALSHLAMAFEAALALQKRVSTVEIQSGPHLLTTTPGGGIELRAREWTHSEPGVLMRVTSPWWRAIWNAALEGWHTADIFRYAGIPVVDTSAIRNQPPGAVGLKADNAGGYRSLWVSPSSRWNVAVLAPRWNAGLIPYAGGNLRPQVWLLADEPAAPLTFATSQLTAVVPWLQLNDHPARGAWAVLWDCDELTWVMDGVPVDAEVSQPLPVLGKWGGVAVADGLQLDLSANRIVRDDVYRRRRNWLEQMVLLHATNRPST